jgi:glycosyltransferase involved in cell wall biosynthesis
MTIVQAIETSGPGGAEQVLLRLCCRLRDRGHAVRPLLLRAGWLSERLEAEGFGVAVIPLRSPLDRGFARQLESFLRSSRADVLHSHEITFAAYGRAATASLGIPHVATAHGRNFAGGWKRRGFGALFLRGGGRFRLVAVSEDLAVELSRAFLVDRGAISVVENGVELPAASRVRERLPGEPLRVVAVGNLYPVKNHGVLIRAVAILAESGVNVEIDILGRGKEEAALRSLASEMKVDGRARLCGFRSDVPAFLARAHVFASSSLSEAMPLSFLEAMGHALPVVASRVGGVPALIEDGVHGLLFESGDARGAAERLARLAGDEALRLRLGEAAAARARDRFGADAMIGRYEGLYAALAKGRAA